MARGFVRFIPEIFKQLPDLRLKIYCFNINQLYNCAGTQLHLIVCSCIFIKK